MDSREFTVATTGFMEIAAEFHERVARMIWCNMATVDEQCRPRSRIVLVDFPAPPGKVVIWRA